MVREGNAPLSDLDIADFPVIHSFDKLFSASVSPCEEGKGAEDVGSGTGEGTEGDAGGRKGRGEEKEEEPRCKHSKLGDCASGEGKETD